MWLLTFCYSFSTKFKTFITSLKWNFNIFWRFILYKFHASPCIPIRAILAVVPYIRDLTVLYWICSMVLSGNRDKLSCANGPLGFRDWTQGPTGLYTNTRVYFQDFFLCLFNINFLFLKCRHIHINLVMIYTSITQL